MSRNTFRTTDLALAAYLVASRKRIDKLDGSPGKRTFSFADVTDADVAAFYSGATVDARTLLAAYRDLKGLLLSRGDRK